MEAILSNRFYVELFTKLRVEFLFNHPFLSVLALSIPTTFESNTNSAFTTNGLRISIDLEKIQKYTDDNITYLYAHTLLHIVLKHPFRQKTRDSYIWNMACDLVVNNILSSFTKIGVMPKDEIVDLELKDKCVEEVYEILYKKKEEEKNDRSKNEKDEDEKIQTTPNQQGNLQSTIYDNSKLDLEEIEDEKSSNGNQEKLDGIIIQALIIAKKNQTLYEGMRIEIDSVTRAKIDLKENLKEYLTNSYFEKTSSYQRANRKYIHSGIYLPGTQKSNQLLEIFVAIDGSSSVSLDEYKEFLGIIRELCEDFYEYTITLLPFDLKVKEEYIKKFDNFHPLNEKDFLIPKSDGGTHFDAVIRYLKESTDIKNGNLLLVLSDGEFELRESLICDTVFIISSFKNIGKFTSFGKVLEFRAK